MKETAYSYRKRLKAEIGNQEARDNYRKRLKAEIGNDE